MANFNDAWYTPCNEQRLKFLEQTFTKGYFRGKTVLDLGGGIGHISSVLDSWGAKCTIYEGRLEHIEKGRQLHPSIEFIQIDLQNDILPDVKFDIVLNFGVFYHLNNPETYISETVKLAKDMMLLDGNISIEGHQQFVENNTCFDQTMHNEVKVITQEDIKHILSDYTINEYGKELDELSDSSPYSYQGNTDKLSHMKQRRIFWLIKK